MEAEKQKMYSLKITQVNSPLDSVYLQGYLYSSLITTVFCSSPPSFSLINTDTYEGVTAVNSLLSWYYFLWTC